MKEKLEIWLRERWRFDNHAKYQQYFDPWFKNLTNSQLHYFWKQMKNIENGSLTNWVTKR